MNQGISRELVAHALIITALCIGGWIMIAQPKARALAELETVIRASEAGDVPLTQSGIERLADRFDEVKSRLKEIESRNELANDSTRLYGSVMQLANTHGVTIERLQPGTKSRALADDKGAATRVDITAAGDYRKVALFLDDIVRMPGFMRPVSLSLQPSNTIDQHVHARLVCEAIRFELPEELALAKGDVHVDQ